MLENGHNQWKFPRHLENIFFKFVLTEKDHVRKISFKIKIEKNLLQGNLYFY